MALYYIRHGLTDWNLEKRIQGHSDICLCEDGIKQAYEAKALMKEIKIDKIYCSPLTRVKQTCDIVNELWNAPITYEERIKERYFGDYEGKILKPKVDMWNFDAPDVVPNGENLCSFFDRVQTFLKEIEEEIQNQNILIVAHGGVSLPCVEYYEGLDRKGNIRAKMILNGEIKKFR